MSSHRMPFAPRRGGNLHNTLPPQGRYGSGPAFTSGQQIPPAEEHNPEQVEDNSTKDES